MQIRDQIDQYFVDRDDPRDTFKQLDPAVGPARILCVYGPDGIGKTWLLRRLYKDCQSPQVCRAWIDGLNSYAKDELLLLGQISKELQIPIAPAEGVPGGAPRTVVGGNVNVGQDMVLGDKNELNINAPVMGNIILDDRSRKDRIIRETEQLISAIKRLPGEKRAVLFLDHFASVPTDPRAWLKEHFLDPVCNRQLPQVLLVIANDQEIAELQSFDYEDVVRQVELEGMDVHAVCEYWGRRGMPDDENLDFFLTFLFGNDPVTPIDMRDSVSRFREGLRKRVKRPDRGAHVPGG